MIDNNDLLSIAVQTAIIPLLVHNRSLSDIHKHPGDICVSAPTGSGKTLAYVLPIIEVSIFLNPLIRRTRYNIKIYYVLNYKILSKRVVTRLRALVVLPTRDLVAQVKETFDVFCKGTSLKVIIFTFYSNLSILFEYFKFNFNFELKDRCNDRSTVIYSRTRTNSWQFIRIVSQYSSDFYILMYN